MPKSINDFEKETIYRVTRGNDTLKVGDSIYFDCRGALLCLDAHGWLETDELDDEVMDFDAEIDPEWELITEEHSWTALKSYHPRKKKGSV